MRRPKTKICGDCGIRKPAEEFSANPNGKYALNTYCKPCYNIRKRAWRREHAVRLRVAERARNAYKREHERNHRALCPSCGNPMAVGSGNPSKRPALCAECFRQEQRRRISERDRELEALWASGKSLKEIGAHFGWSIGHLGQEMFRARSRGAVLPYRHTGPHQPGTRRDLRPERAA